MDGRPKSWSEDTSRDSRRPRPNSSPLMKYATHNHTRLSQSYSRPPETPTGEVYEDHGKEDDNLDYYENGDELQRVKARLKRSEQKVTELMECERRYDDMKRRMHGYENQLKEKDLIIRKLNSRWKKREIKDDGPRTGEMRRLEEKIEELALENLSLRESLESESTEHLGTDVAELRRKVKNLEDERKRMVTAQNEMAQRQLEQVQDRDRLMHEIDELKQSYEDELERMRERLRDRSRLKARAGLSDEEMKNLMRLVEALRRKDEQLQLQSMRALVKDPLMVGDPIQNVDHRIFRVNPDVRLPDDVSTLKDHIHKLLYNVSQLRQRMSRTQEDIDYVSEENGNLRYALDALQRVWEEERELALYWEEKAAEYKDKANHFKDDQIELLKAELELAKEEWTKAILQKEDMIVELAESRRALLGEIAQEAFHRANADALTLKQLVESEREIYSTLVFTKPELKQREIMAKTFFGDLTEEARLRLQNRRATMNETNLLADVPHETSVDKSKRWSLW